MQIRSINGIFKPRPNLTLEYNALRSNNTWSLVTTPKGRTVVGNKLVFKIKENLDCSIKKFKARLVTKGFLQKFDSDYSEHLL